MQGHLLPDGILFPHLPHLLYIIFFSNKKRPAVPARRLWKYV